MAGLLPIQECTGTPPTARAGEGAVCEEKPRSWCAGEKGKANRGKGEGIRSLPVGGRLFTPVARRGRERPQRGGLPSLLPAAAGAIGPARSLRAVGVERDEGQGQRAEGLKGKNVWPTRMLRQLKRGELGAKSRGVGIGGWFGLLGLRGSWSGERREQKRRP